MCHTRSHQDHTISLLKCVALLILTYLFEFPKVFRSGILEIAQNQIKSAMYNKPLDHHTPTLTPTLTPLTRSQVEIIRLESRERKLRIGIKRRNPLGP